MTRLDPSAVAAFARAYRFPGGRLRRVKLRYAGGDRAAAEFTVAVRTAVKDLGTEPVPVKLRFKLTGVEEFRFQKRPSSAAGTVADARIGFFQGLFFVNLDAWTLAPGDTPKVHDFRASDSYVAGRDLFWEEVEVKK